MLLASLSRRIIDVPQLQRTSNDVTSTTTKLKLARNHAQQSTLRQWPNGGVGSRCMQPLLLKQQTFPYCIFSVSTSRALVYVLHEKQWRPRCLPRCRGERWNLPCESCRAPLRVFNDIFRTLALRLSTCQKHSSQVLLQLMVQLHLQVAHLLSMPLRMMRAAL